MPAERRRIRHSEVTWRLVGDQVVLLDLAAARYHELNEVASLLWQRLVEGATADELVAELVERYDAPVDQVRADVESFLETCHQRRWIE